MLRKDSVDDKNALIRVEGVSKKFCRSLKKSLWYGVQDVFSEFNPLKGETTVGGLSELRSGEFWAVRDVSFEVKRGECLGLIGHNGAGKTTLLRMLNGLIKPDTGRIEMLGRIGALIALGTGFNPILSGRENVYVNASIRGLTKREIDQKIDDIIDFAEIGEFIDAPVQSYSSGMHVRLGFAVATALKPDVLILDEILSVGDARFRMKCYDRLHSIMKECAVILVSHDMVNILNVANSVGYMKSGSFTYFSNVSEGVSKYDSEMARDRVDGALRGENVLSYPMKSLEANLEKDSLFYRDDLVLEVSCSLEESVVASIMVRLSTKERKDVFSWDSHRYGDSIELPKGVSKLRIKIPNICLRSDTYSCSIYVRISNSLKYLAYIKGFAEIRIETKSTYESVVPYIAEQGDVDFVV